MKGKKERKAERDKERIREKRSEKERKRVRRIEKQKDRMKEIKREKKDKTKQPRHRFTTSLRISFEKETIHV